MKNLLLSACLLLLGASASVSAAPESPDAGRAAAARALADVSAQAAPAQARSLGFQDPSEVRTSTLGEPLAVFLLPLDALQRYQGEEPGRLLVDLKRRVYPVQVEGETRSLVEVQLRDGRWETARVGGAQKVRLLETQRRGVMRTRGALASDFFELRIPALQLVFLAHHGPEGLFVTPLLDESGAGLRAGQPELATQVFSRLVERARQTSSRMP